ncbi:MAG: hypothetical protein M9963_08905 [Kiritimatiellae bacterium]|nr:hypothetical protein [Kiritimatiellia bacterium]
MTPARPTSRFFTDTTTSSFLPLYVLWNAGSLLRRATIRRHAWAVLKLLVVRLRQAWPE